MSAAAAAMSSMTTTLSRMERLLVSPRTVASTLNWQMNLLRPILSLHFGQSCIDLALLAHPAARYPTATKTTRKHKKSQKFSKQSLIHTLPSIPLGRHHETISSLRLPPHVLEQLSNVVNDHKVCGLVVSWPGSKSQEPTTHQEHEDGGLGASCDRVLQALDQMVQETNIVTNHRPICLWDGRFHHHSLPHYSDNKDNQEEHGAQPTQAPASEDGLQAAAVAADYLRTHWPDLTLKMKHNDGPAQDETLNDSHNKTTLLLSSPSVSPRTESHHGDKKEKSSNEPPVDPVNRPSFQTSGGEIDELEESLWTQESLPEPSLWPPSIASTSVVGNELDEPETLLWEATS